MSLSVLGWKPLDKKALDMLDRTPRCIFIFPHTSYFDFLLYLAYIKYHPVLKRRSRVLVNPAFTDKFQWLLKHVGSIPATKREVSGGGATKHIYKHLNKMDEFIFMVSPRGTMAPHHTWRSGFYYLSKMLNCPIIVAGLDYERKTFVIKEPYYANEMTFEQACQRGKDDMYNIIPRHPQKAEYSIGPHDPTKLGLMTTWRWVAIWVIAILIVIVILIIIWLVFLACRGKKPPPVDKAPPAAVRRPPRKITRP